MEKLFSALRSVLVPSYCPICRLFLTSDTVLCASCLQRIKPVVSVQLSITATRAIPVFCLSGYEEPLNYLILAKQWSQQIASVQLAELLWRYTIVSSLYVDYIVPIPLHWTRKAWRGYNQAEVMAKHLAARSGKTMLPALRRKKMTKYQARIKVEQRADNVFDAFEIKNYKQEIAGKHILLVDDLMTTGATLRTATKELLTCKPASICAVVACRVV